MKSDYFSKPGYYRIKVIPGQANAEIRGVMDDGTVKIALTAQPEKGKANRELISFLADSLGVSKNSIKISSGLTSRLKVISLEEPFF